MLLTNQANIVRDLEVQLSGMVCKSDDNSKEFKINLKLKRLKSAKRKIHNMKKADFKSINTELNIVPWEFILDYDDINKS